MVKRRAKKSHAASFPSQPNLTTAKQILAATNAKVRVRKNLFEKPEAVPIAAWTARSFFVQFLLNKPVNMSYSRP